MEGRVLDWMGRHVAKADIIVNATSVGMHPDVDDTPFHAGAFQPGMIVFDTVYNPESTVFIKDARNRGCHTVTGVELFVRQAAVQFHMFTGRTAETELMRQIVRRALSPLTHHTDDEEEE